MASVVFPSFLLIATCFSLYVSTPALAASPPDIASMLPESKVPQESINDMCSKTKDPDFCNKFAEGDMQTFLTIGDKGKTKVLNTAIDILSVSDQQFSSTLKNEKISEEDKNVVQTCLALYEKVKVSLKESATTADSGKLGRHLQAAGESLWQCEVALQAAKDSKVAQEIRVSNSLTNYFVSYMQNEFYAHIVTKY
ncbi:hypothetical protein L6164_023563 [Bauhinia variegata]|uniref:Uncharacterized protein n=1 Tax=Bauhinia variegata TaxID=167791 RepID=A0ACB9MIQ9_BAUVA|nr:hypothetical protein L6164_023563 [Bauhinia variegata]